MRKYTRKIMKYDAEKKGVKASMFVHDEFEELQNKKYGETRTMINKVIGTHPRKLWKHRIGFVVK